MSFLTATLLVAFYDMREYDLVQNRDTTRVSDEISDHVYRLGTKSVSIGNNATFYLPLNRDALPKV